MGLKKYPLVNERQAFDFQISFLNGYAFENIVIFYERYCICISETVKIQNSTLRII